MGEKLRVELVSGVKFEEIVYYRGDVRGDVGKGVEAKAMCEAEGED